jgi:hypothetical protein
MKRLSLLCVLAALACERGLPPLAAEARMFGRACLSMGGNEAEECGGGINACGVVATVDVELGDGTRRSTGNMHVCTRWCAQSCPSGTYCPNPSHARLDTLTAGFCFRMCNEDSDCEPGFSVCEERPDPGAPFRVDPPPILFREWPAGGCVPDCRAQAAICGIRKCGGDGHCH